MLPSQSDPDHLDIAGDIVARAYTSLESNLARLLRSTKNVPSSGIVSSGMLFIPRIRKLWLRIFSQHYLNCEIIRKTPKIQQQENCYVSPNLYSKRNNM